MQVYRTKGLTVTVYDRDAAQDKNILGQCKIDLLDCRKINLSWQTFKLDNPYNPGALQYVQLAILNLPSDLFLSKFAKILNLA